VIPDAYDMATCEKTEWKLPEGNALTDQGIIKLLFDLPQSFVPAMVFCAVGKSAIANSLNPFASTVELSRR
jgi:hypothetical protein